MDPAEIARKAQEKMRQKITPITSDAEPATAEPAPIPVPDGNPGLQTLADMLKPYMGLNLSDGKLKALVDDAVSRFTPKPKIVHVYRPDGEKVELGMVHYLVAKIVKLVSLQPFTRRGIWLVGPAGSGKTTACGKVAEALGLRYFPFAVGSQTTKSDLVGFVDAHGKAVWTVIREAFTNGGLLLLDEIDAANAGVITILNSLLANDRYTWPDGITTERHADFRYVAAANTFGTGANLQYIGRAATGLDAATLDRFSMLQFDYDHAWEKALAINAAESIKEGSTPVAVKWHERVVTLRKAAEKAGVRVVISPRAAIAGAALLASGESESDVEQSEIWGYGRVKADDRASIMEHV